LAGFLSFFHYDIINITTDFHIIDIAMIQVERPAAAIADCWLISCGLLTAGCHSYAWLAVAATVVLPHNISSLPKAFATGWSLGCSWPLPQY